MLERAATCFESAGRRFLRDPNGAVRTRRSLSRHFWKHNVAGGDASSWLLALLQPSDQSTSSVSNPPHGKGSASEGCSPLLDFLYPQKAQELATLRLFRHSRRLGLRRRKRSLVGSPRTYGTEATNLRKILLDDSNAPMPEEEIDIPLQATKDLSRLLEMQEKDFDKAWVLYVAAGHPPNLRSALCSYLSTSTQSGDQDHAWQVFEEIPLESRSARDFINITVSQLLSEQPSRLKSICVDAVSRGFADVPCALCFAYYAKRNDLINVLDIWSLGSRSSAELNRPRPEKIISRLKKSLLPGTALDLGKFLADSPHDATARDLAETLLDKITRSFRVLGNTPMDVLLRLLREYHELGVLKETHYFNTIETLQRSRTRPTFVRSMLFYRHLRQNLPQAKPPAKLLNGQISALGSFEITHSVEFFLDEFAHFWEKPSIEAYKQALIIFSRTGDALQVNSIFDRLVADHGKPRSRRLLTPLLYVHARAGNVRETHTQFRRVAEEFQLEPNTTCWNILLKAYATTKDPAGALSTFVAMVDHGVPPDSHTFGTLMGICAGRGDIDSTRWLLKEAQRRQVEITMPMIDTIVQVYCQNRRPDLAEQLARATRRMHIEGSRVRMWNTILVQYALRMDRDAWLRARRYMRRNQLRPDAMTYAARLLMLALKNQADRAREFLRNLHKTRVIQATELHYSIVLLAYLRVRNRQMVRIILNEVLQRFGQDMSTSSLLKFMSLVDHDLELVETDYGSGTRDAHLRLEDTEKSLVHSFTTFHGTPLAAKFPFLKNHEESRNNGLSTSRYEYLVSHYGTRGTIEQATEMFNKYLESKDTATPPESESDLVPFRVINIMMRAHLAADEYDKVEEFWQMALSNAIKVAQPFRLDQFFASNSSLSSSASAKLDASPESTTGPAGDEPERQVDFPPESSALHQQPSVLPSKRFILSQLFSIYMRALAYQNETEKIYHAVTELEAAGFEMSGANWSTYVQMLAASDRQADLIEAFAVFEYKFMPNFPGWGPLKRGYALKPETASRWTHLLEFSTTYWKSIRRQREAGFLGRQARKRWRKLEPERLMPTYVTTVYLAAALNRIRDTSILEGNSNLKELYEVAPRTIQMIGQMPYLRDKFQGALLRGREQRPDPPLSVHDKRVARGGVLGRGTTPQLPWPARRRRPHDHHQLPQDKQPSGDHQPTEGQQPMESQQPTESQQSTEGKQTTEGQQPTESQQSTEGKQTTESKQVPHMNSSTYNETAQLLSDLFGPEDSSGRRKDLLSPEDRLDIESDIRYLRNLRGLREAKRLAEEKERAYQEELETARKAKKSNLPFEVEERDEDDLEDDMEELRELRELDELDSVDSEELDRLRELDDPDVENPKEGLGEPDEPDLKNLEEFWETSKHDGLKEIDEVSANDVKRQPEAERVGDAGTSAAPKGETL